MSQWQKLIDQIANHVELLKELGVKRIEIDKTLLQELAAAQRISTQPPSAAPGYSTPTPPQSPPVDTASSAPAAASHSLAELDNSVAQCAACVLATTRAEPPVAGIGNLNAPDIMFIADTMPKGEDLALLQKMMVAMGYQPHELYLTAICKCTPPGRRPPTPDERRACMGHLRSQIRYVAPKTIVLLGEDAIRGIFAATPHLTPQLNHWINVNNRNIMPIRHPAYMRRFPAAKRDAWGALKEVLKLLGRSPPKT